MAAEEGDEGERDGDRSQCFPITNLDIGWSEFCMSQLFTPMSTTLPIDKWQPALHFEPVAAV